MAHGNSFYCFNILVLYFLTGGPSSGYFIAHVFILRN